MIVKKKKQICSNNKYSSCAYVSKLYYFLDKNRIDIYNEDLINTSKITLNDNYIAIDYNKCFYLTKEKEVDKIYIHNTFFKEVDQIVLKSVPSNLLSKINSIQVTDDYIIITSNNGIYKVTKCGCYIGKIKINKHDVILNNNCCKKVLVNNYQSSSFICNKLLIAYNNSNSAYIYNVSNNDNVIDKWFIDDDIYIKNILENKNRIMLFVVKDNKYNYIYYLDEVCKEKDSCNCNCVVASVAKEEYKIAKLIESLARSINKAIDSNVSVDMLIKINYEVNKSLNNIIHIEEVLCDKLRCCLKCNK